MITAPLFTEDEYDRLILAIIRGHAPAAVDQAQIAACLAVLEAWQLGHQLLTLALQGQAVIRGLNAQGEPIFVAAHDDAPGTP